MQIIQIIQITIQDIQAINKRQLKNKNKTKYTGFLHISIFIFNMIGTQYIKQIKKIVGTVAIKISISTLVNNYENINNSW